jgi:hypothetical protein
MKFKIKQGNHYTNKRWWIRLNRKNRFKKIAYSVVLSSNWYYNDNIISYSGWNKIFGFGAINHHNISARLVCKPDKENKDKLIIASYVYKNGEWYDNIFSYTYTENAKSMAIRVIEDDDITKRGYKFYCGYDSIFIQHDNPRYEKKLWPYFGGWDRSYKDIFITLKKITDIKW